jgi:hypothetical protein
VASFGNGSLIHHDERAVELKNTTHKTKKD